MKKNISLTNVIVYFLIVLFIILIILPPLARIFLKVDTPNDTNNNNNLNTATALTCRKEIVVGTMIYNVAITSNYGNDVLNKVTFLYEMPEVIDNTVTENPVLIEIETLRNSGLVTETTTDSLSTTFVLTKETMEAYPDNMLTSYFYPLELQTSNLESLGYSCSSLTV